MQFQSYKIADLIPASYNPRKKLKPGDKEYEKIKNSIKEFGYVEPIIINSDMTIIGGHQRATVLADLGYTEVECIVVDIDKTKEKALNVALNKITGEWNKELLADLIKDLEDSAFDVGITALNRQRSNSFLIPCMIRRSRKMTSMWKRSLQSRPWQRQGMYGYLESTVSSAVIPFCRKHMKG